MRDIAMILMTALLLSLVSCTDDIVENAGSKDVVPFEGYIICFSAGTTENKVGSRAEEGSNSITPGRTYYMPDSYRFVCRM